MAKFSIIPKGGGTARYSGCPSFTGTYMKPGVLEFRKIAVPSPIAWEVGDYVEYTRTGRTYRLYTVPQVKKQARSTEYGGAFVYQSVQFFDDSKQLEICPFRDLVPDDNRIHFSTQPAIAVFDDVAGIAERLQTCLVDMYGANSWVVRVATVGGDGISQDLADLMAEDRDFSVSGVNILQCLDKIYDVWPEVGWVYKIESGTNTIIIGGAGLTNTNSYQYGKGNGLKSITRVVANADEIATRIFAYGSSRNMLPRWYNNQTIKDADSVDIQNLMIPVSEWGETLDNGTLKPDPAKAYIDADSATIERLGLRPKTYYFDGSGDLPDIYPTVRKMTIGDVRAAKNNDPNQPNYPSASIYADATVRVDTVLSAPLSFDSGLAGSGGGKETIFTDYKNSTATDSESVSGDVKIYTRSIFTESFSLGSSVAGTRDLSFAIDLSGTVQVTGIKGAKVTAYLRKGHPANAAIISREMKLEESTTAGTYIFVPFTLTGSRKVVEEATYYLVIDLEVELDASSSARTLAYDAVASISASVQNYRETTFKLGIRQIGFDINEQANLGEGKTIAMRSGKCAGRSFVIKNCTYVSATDSWSLDVIRSEDESLSQWFPNTDYPILAGDEFVLLDIAMPDEYILVAERNLLAAAQELLADVSVERWQYTPDIDAKFMVENSRTILPAQNMVLSDANIIGNDPVAVLIDSVTISEGEAAIPTYKVTLRDRKRKTFTESKGADGISSNPVTKSSSQVAKEASTTPSVVSDSYFTLDENGNVTLKEAYQNLWVPGWLADGGIGTGGGGGGSSTLRGLNDVDIPVNPGTDDILSYNGSMWVNVSKSNFLSGLATTQDLASKQDAYPFTIQGASGATYNLANFITGVTVVSNDAEIGTTLTTLATVGGVDIKAKIPNVDLSGYVTSVKVGNTSYNPSSGVVSLPAYPDITGKADKVSGATSGHFAGLDANGNLVDSGHSASGFVTALDVNGNYLTWYEGGNGYNITIPYANNAGVASSLGSSTVGDQYTPIYLNGGLPYQVSGVLTDLLIEPKRADITPTTLPLVNTTSANRLALLPADQIIIEKTTNGGTTWDDAGFSDAQKMMLFLGNAESASIQIPMINNVRDKRCGLRITITGMKYSVPAGTSETQKYNYWNSTYASETERYCSLRGFYFWVSAVTDGIRTKIYRAKGNDSNSWEVVSPDENIYLTGWSGGNYLRLDSPGVFGGGVGQTDNWWNYRIVLFTDGSNGGNLDTNYTDSAQAIHRISAYGESIWSSPNNLASIDHLYTWDSAKTAIFPAALSLSGSTKETRRIYFGSSSHYIELEEISTGNFAFHFSDAIYSDSWIADGGIGSGSGSGGSTTLYGLNDVSIPQPPSSPNANDVLAYSTTLGKWTNVAKSTFLSGYATATDLAGKQDLIDASHKLSYTLLTDTPTIPTVPTNVSAFTNDAGYITGNQTITLSGDVSGSGTTSIAVSIGSGKVTNTMLAGSIENSKLNTIGVTKGGTGLTTISKGAILYGSASDTIAALSANGTNTKKFLSQTSNNAPAWSELAATDIPNLGAGKITSGTLDFDRLPAIYIGRNAAAKNAGDVTLLGITGFTTASSASASGDTSLVVWEPNGGGTGVGVWHFKGNIVADGWIADGGIGSGSGGNAGTLAELNDVTLSSLANWDVLTYNSSSNHWVNTTKATFLSGYVLASSLATVATSGSYNDLTNLPTIPTVPTNVSSFTNDAGYLTDADLVDYDFEAGTVWLGDGYFEGGTYATKPRPKWKYAGATAGSTVTENVAFLSDIPTSLKNPKALTFGSQTYDGSVAKTITASDLGALTSHQTVSLTGGTNSGTLKLTVGSTATDNIVVTNVVTTDGTQTITGAKTFSTNNITLNGVSILPYGDAVDGGSGLGYLGSSSKRFRQGHIRDLYTSYFIFKDGDTGNTQGSINFLTGAGFFNVVDRTNFPINPKTFSYKFYVNSNDNGLFYDETYKDDNNVTQHGNYVPLGKSDHRWSKIWGMDEDLSGNLKLSGTTKKIYFGDTYYIELVDLGSGNTPRYALHTNAPIYSDSWIADGGIQQTS